MVTGKVDGGGVPRRLGPSIDPSEKDAQTLNGDTEKLTTGLTLFWIEVLRLSGAPLVIDSQLTHTTAREQDVRVAFHLTLALEFSFVFVFLTTNFGMFLLSFPSLLFVSGS